MRVSQVQHRVRVATRRSPARPSPEVRRRLALLRAVSHLTLRGDSVTFACVRLGLSRATYYRWAARLAVGSVEALEPTPRRPKSRKAAPVRRAIAPLIEELRRDATTGKEALAAILKRRGVTVSASSVGRCLSELFARSVIHRYRPRRKQHRRRTLRPFARRTPHLEPTAPGDVIQVDTLHLNWDSLERYGAGDPWRHFSAIDRVSRYAFATLGKRARASDAKTFLDELLKQAPFPIKAIQVDQGSEYRAEFELACQDNGITLYENRAHEPRQNAYVERLQRTFRDEFYRREHSLDPNEVRTDLDAYLHNYNHHRPHAGLNYRTPAEYLQDLENPHSSHKT